MGAIVTNRRPPVTPVTIRIQLLAAIGPLGRSLSGTFPNCDQRPPGAKARGPGVAPCKACAGIPAPCPDNGFLTTTNGHCRCNQLEARPEGALALRHWRAGG